MAKGALTEEQVEERFAAWLAEKDAANTAEISALNKEKEAAKAKALEAEKEANEKRAAEIAAANAPEPEVVEEALADSEITDILVIGLIWRAGFLVNSHQGVPPSRLGCCQSLFCLSSSVVILILGLMTKLLDLQERSVAVPSLNCVFGMSTLWPPLDGL